MLLHFWDIDSEDNVPFCRNIGLVDNHSSFMVEVTYRWVHNYPVCCLCYYTADYLN